MRNIKILDLVIPRRGTGQRSFYGMMETFLDSGADYAVLYDAPGIKSDVILGHIQNFLFRHPEYNNVEAFTFRRTFLLKRLDKT